MEMLDPQLEALCAVHRERCRMNVEIDKFLRRTGMTKAALGKAALGDHGSVSRIMDGRKSLTEYTEKRLRRWMTENPEGVRPGKPGRPRKS